VPGLQSKSKITNFSIFHFPLSHNTFFKSFQADQIASSAAEPSNKVSEVCIQKGLLLYLRRYGA
jgi:hypothetical protein